MSKRILCPQIKRADISAFMAAYHPALYRFVISKGVVPARLLLYFTMLQRIYRAYLYTGIAMITNRILSFVTCKFPFAQNRSQPDHASKFRCDKQRMSPDRPQACSLCRMLLGNDRAPSLRFFVPLALVRWDWHTNDLIFFHVHAKVKGDGIHFCRDRISHPCIRYRRAAAKGSSRKSAGKRNNRFACR